METTKDRGGMFIIHAGLHKTGSTAIQQYFGSAGRDDVHYLRWRDANHSDLSVLLFDERPEDFWVFQREGRSAADLAVWRAEVLAGLGADLAAKAGQCHVFSAERLARADEAAVRRMKAAFAPYTDAFRIIIYVRPAAGYMASMAQQYIRTGTPALQMVWPEYRAAIEKFDRVFGREAVDVRVYNPPGQPGWDAVTDFCEAVGLAPPGKQVARANVGMGARPLALMLARHVARGGGPTTAEEAEADHAFLEGLLAEPSPRFALSPQLVAQEMTTHAEDLAWIEARLGGVSMSSMAEPAEGAVVFGSTEDVLRYAEGYARVDGPRPGTSSFGRRLLRRLRRLLRA